MTKIAFALGLLNHLRFQKTPPLARYCCLLALAESPGRHMTGAQIFRRFGLPHALAGSLESAVRQGLVQEFPTSPKTYAITPAGGELVTNLLAAATEPEPAANPAARTP